MNFFTVREISKEFDLEVLRFFILSAHYRKPVNFSREFVEQAKNGLDRLYNGKKNLEYLINNTEEKTLTDKDNEIKEEIIELKKKFIDSMEDDINTADAISFLFEIVKAGNSKLNQNSPKELAVFAYDILMELSGILGILNKEDELLDEEIAELIDKRVEARKNKDFKLADQIRDNLKEKGIILEDTKGGVKWKRVR